MNKLLTIAALFATVGCHAGEQFKVTTAIYADNRLVATPTVVLDADQQARVANDRFDLTLTVSRNPDQTAKVVTHVKVGAQQMSPIIHVTLDKPATIEIGTQKLELQVSAIAP